MAVLARLFKGCKSHRSLDSKLPNIDHKDSWENTSLKREQIRLILFKDHDIQGRKLIFDSKAVTKIEGIKEEPCKRNKINKNEEFNLSNSNEQLFGECTPKYQITRAGSDVKLLGEMMFGSAPITHQGTTLRVHSIRAPPQLLITKVFIPNRPSNRESSGYGEESFDGASLNLSLNDMSSSQSINTSSRAGSVESIAQSIPVDVPFSSRKSNKDDDSGLSLSASSQASSSFHTPYPSPGSSSSINSNSFNSLHRRWMRSQATCLEYGIRKRASFEGLDGQPTPPSQRRSKIGLGIVFEVDEKSKSPRAEHFESFFFSHFTLIEGHINKLILAIEHACGARRNFMNNVMESLEVFRQSIADMYLAPRLSQPVWLDMMAYSTHRYSLCAKYMKELMQSIDKYDTKNTNFFLSTLITAVLTYHLAWVPTVTPAGASQSRAYHDKHSAKWLDTLAKSHPYNPLWAQLSDMYGALGFPLRLARTVVVGKNKDIVCKILYILSYFIRCSEIHENVDEQMDTEELYNDLSICKECGASTRGTTPAPENNPIYSHVMNACERVNISAVKNYTELSETSDTGSSVYESNTSLAGQSTSASDSGIDSDDWCYSGEDSDYKRCVGKSCFYQPLPVVSVVNCEKPVQYSEEEELTKCQSPEVGGVNCGKPVQFSKEEELVIRCQSPIVGVAAGDCGKPVQYSGEEELSNKCQSPMLEENQLWTESDCDKTLECIQPEQSETPVCETHRTGPSIDTNLSINTDTEKMVFKEVECTLSPEEILPTRVECVRNVGRSAIETSQKFDGLGMRESYDAPFQSPPKKQSVVPRSPTKVTTQLQNGKTFFRWPSREGSNSMFDEYFTGDSETNNDIIDLITQPDSSLSNNSDYNRLELCQSMSDGSVTPTPSQFEKSQGSDQCDSDKPDVKRKVDMLFKVPVKPSTAQVDNRCLSPKCNDEEVEHHNKYHPAFFRSISQRNELSPVAESPHSCITRQESCASTRTVTPAGVCRCHSVTPTGRSRHPSACSLDAEHDPFVDLVDLPLPSSKTIQEIGNDSSLSAEQSFGRSLIGDFSDHYMSDFVLHGTNDKDFQAKLVEDLNLTVQNPVLDEAVTESVGIIADTDQWQVQLVSSLRATSNTCGKVITASQLVTSMIESVTDLWTLKMSAEFCLMHMEDRMQEMYFKSRMLAEYIKSQKKVDMDELTAMLGFEASDLQLLFSIAGTHSPQIAFGIY